MFNELEIRRDQEKTVLENWDYSDFLSSNKRLDNFPLNYYRALDLILKLNIYNKVKHTGKNVRIINAAVEPCMGHVGKEDFIMSNSNFRLNTLTLMLNYGVKDVKSAQLPLDRASFGVLTVNRAINRVIESLDEAGLIDNQKIHEALTSTGNPETNLRNGIIAINNELINSKISPERIEKLSDEFLNDNIHVDYYQHSGAYPQEVADAHPMHKVVENVVKEQFEVSKNKYMESFVAPVIER